MTKISWNILVVDDNPADAEILRRNLGKIEEFDTKATVEHSAREGESALSKVAYDCVLLDYKLGAISGLDVLREIRDRGNDVPVIFFTGHGNESIAVEAMKRGAQDYLSKDNVAPQVLRRAIANAMHRVALERRVREKQQELEHFVSVVAHDLQQPLCAVRGHVELIRDYYGDRLDDAGRGFVHSAINMAGRMSGMIDSLLAYSRVGRSGATLAPVDLNRCLEEVISRIQPLVVQSRGTVNLGPLPRVQGDEQALAQLFQNLLSNGLKFRGDADPEVSVSAQAEGVHWHIVVEDNGIGIDPKHHEEVFAPFKRLHSRAVYEGSGVGLATCKRIIDQHRGRIWLESELGKGTAIHCILAAAEERSNPLSETCGPRSVLIISNHAETGLLLTGALRKHGCQTLTASGVGEALALLDRLPVDAVIAPIGSPWTSAIDGIRQIHRRYPSIALIAASESSDTDVPDFVFAAAKAAGASRLFPRHYDVSDLARAACALAAPENARKELYSGSTRG